MQIRPHENPVSAAGGSAIQVDAAPLAPVSKADTGMGVLAEAVIAESAHGDELSVPQNHIYNEYVNTVDALTRDALRVPAGADERYRDSNRRKGTRKNWVLPESFSRLNYPSRLKNEYEEALRTALHGSHADFNGLNAREIAAILSNDVGSKVGKNIVEAFRRDAADLLQRYKDWSTDKHRSPLARSRSSSREDLTNASAIDRDAKIIKAVSTATEAGVAKLERLEPIAKRKMRLVIEKAVEKTPDGDLPFAVATPLQVSSEVPPLPTTIQDMEEGVGGCIASHCRRGGAYAMAENALGNGEAIKSVVIGWVGCGILKGMENATKAAAVPALASAGVAPREPFRRSDLASISYPSTREPGSSSAGITAGITGTIGAVYALGRDFHTGYRLMRAKLHRTALKKELQDPSSSYRIARRNLALAYGTRWVEDFERWSSDHRGLSLDTAAMIAKELRAHLHHAPALVGENILYEQETLHTNMNMQELERRRARGESGSARYQREQATMMNIISSLSIDQNIVKHNAEGIRCLARFEEAKPTDDAKKLHEIFRKEPIHATSTNMQASVDSFLREKYPLSTSYFNWP